jgi:hypothetical protein
VTDRTDPAPITLTLDEALEAIQRELGEPAPLL